MKIKEHVNQQIIHTNEYNMHFRELKIGGNLARR